MSNLKAVLLTIFLIIFSLYLIKVFNISYPITIVSTSKTSELAVVGEAKMEVSPDTAYVYLGVISNEVTVKQVQEKINQVSNQLIEQLKKLGIKKEAIKTTNYSIYPRYDYEKGEKIIGYTGNVDLQIKIKDFKLISPILTKAEELGINQIKGVKFSIDQPEIYREKVREKAIENAKKQAEKLAKTLGIKLGRVTNIIESSPQTPISYLKSPAIGSGGERDSMAIEPGLETISTVVTLYFEKR